MRFPGHCIQRFGFDTHCHLIASVFQYSVSSSQCFRRLSRAMARCFSFWQATISISLVFLSSEVCKWSIVKLTNHSRMAKKMLEFNANNWQLLLELVIQYSVSRRERVRRQQVLRVHAAAPRLRRRPGELRAVFQPYRSVRINSPPSGLRLLISLSFHPSYVLSLYCFLQLLPFRTGVADWNMNAA